jgi:hypothetical protein
MEPMSEPMQEQTTQTVEPALPSQDAGVKTQATQASPEQQAPERTEQKVALPPDGLALDEEGELQFGDAFFDAFREEGAPAEPKQKQEPEPETAPQGQPQPQAAETPPTGFYTPEELTATPLEQIQDARFPEAMRPYLPVIRDYVLGLHRQIGLLQGMQAQQGHSPQQAASPQSEPTAPRHPKTMGPKDWAAAAQKLACERLGIPEGGIDCYDPEHVAALSMAAQEISEQRRAEAAQAQHTQQAYQEFTKFSAELAGRPDFAEFDRWVTDKLAKAGMSSDQLYEYARRTGDIAGVHRTVAEMYQMWQGQKGAVQKPDVKPGTQSPQKIPVVEVSGGAAQVKKSFDVSRLGELEEDEQAKVFMDMGLV